MTEENNTKPDGDVKPEVKVIESDKKGTDAEINAEYLKELRNENKTRRLEAEKLKLENEDMRNLLQQAAQHKNEFDTHVKTSNERIIRAELRAQATAAGMHDLDGLKLADLSGLTIDENGGVAGAAELIQYLKENKAYLFKEVNSTTTNPNLPAAGASQGKGAPDMNDAEWNKSLGKYGIRALT
jgi:hypothetical protein